MAQTLDSGWEVIISLDQSIDTLQHTQHRSHSQGPKKGGCKICEGLFCSHFLPQFKTMTVKILAAVLLTNSRT